MEGYVVLLNSSVKLIFIYTFKNAVFVGVLDIFYRYLSLDTAMHASAHTHTHIVNELTLAHLSSLTHCPWRLITPCTPNH